MAEQLYRTLRVLEYVGERDALQVHFECRAVKGVSPLGWDAGKVRIFEAILGEYPQPLTDQVKVKLMQMILEALEGTSFPLEVDTLDYRDGYAAACNEILQFIGYTPERKE
jgi:hypothetical protein